jgi:hypothetical protein
MTEKKVIKYELIIVIVKDLIGQFMVTLYTIVFTSFLICNSCMILLDYTITKLKYRNYHYVKGYGPYWYTE